jgi:hypothetical protein
MADTPCDLAVSSSGLRMKGVCYRGTHVQIPRPLRLYSVKVTVIKPTLDATVGTESSCSGRTHSSSANNDQRASDGMLERQRACRHTAALSINY